MAVRISRFAMAFATLLVTACWVGCGAGGSDAPTANIQGGNDPAAPANPSVPAAPAEAAEWTPPAPRVNLHPEVLIKTSHGEVVVRLDREKAPITVDNFLSYVEGKFYDDSLIHFVARDSMVLAGAYDAQWTEKRSGAPIFNEASNGLTNRRGTIAMSHAPDSVHSATSQFFFSLAENKALDHRDTESVEGYGYCVFGEVVKGIEILDRISQLPTQPKGELASAPAETVLIQSVTVLR